MKRATIAFSNGLGIVPVKENDNPIKCYNKANNLFYGLVMKLTKKQYSKDVQQMVQNFCAKLVKGNKDAIPTVLGISIRDNNALINKIIISLPERQFLEATPEKLSDIEAYIAKHYMLFQIYEDLDDELYIPHLITFIRTLGVDIDKEYYQ